MRVLTDVALLLHELPIPTVAKVDGVAVGAGLDVRVTSGGGGVHGSLLPGPCPREQVEERVGVAGEVGDDEHLVGAGDFL